MIFNIKITGKKLLFAGGGKIAEAKIKKLIKESPEISVIAPEVTEYIRTLGKEGKINIIEREIRIDDITENYFLVICATNNQELNRKISIECRKLGILHDDLSNHRNSDIMMVASTIIGNLTLTISTDGVAPSIARRLKTELEEDLMHNSNNFEEDIKTIYNKKM